MGSGICLCRLRLTSESAITTCGTVEMSRPFRRGRICRVRRVAIHLPRHLDRDTSRDERESIGCSVLAPNLQTPLGVMLEFMRDPANPPGFRGEMAKAAAPYVYSKAPEAAPAPTVQITQIEKLR
jgi:hypothetical protein